MDNAGMGMRRWAGVLVLALCVTVPGIAPPAAAAGTTTTGSGDVLVRLVRSGGFAGLVDRVSVSGDGHVRVRRDGAQVFVLSLRPRQLVRLRTTLRVADLPGLASDYPAPGADMYRYAITSQGVTVTATEVAGPERLRRLITLLTGYLTPHD
jgi:hypothetical protein